jgi:PmbA protein
MAAQPGQPPFRLDRGGRRPKSLLTQPEIAMPLDVEPLALITDLLDRAKRAGADDADAVMFSGASLSVAWRLGALEKLERSEARDLGLRVLVGKRQAIVSTNDFKPDMLSELVERAVATARAAPEDRYCGIATLDQIAREVPSLDMCDDFEPTAEALIEQVRIAEDSARAVSGVTNSEGAEAGWSRSVVALAATNGFARSYAGSSHSVSASVLAGEGTGMERDYDYATAVYRADLRDPAEIGRTAGERAVRRLGARKIKSSRVPVVFDKRISGGLLRSLSGAINGASIARGTSFLKDKMGQAVFGPGINVIDDPHRPRGLRSKPFDAEGIANERRAVIEDGRLTTWFLDLASSRQLGLTTTGHAARGTASPPSPAPTNLYMERGKIAHDDMIRDIDQGLLITEMIGMGVSIVTGDYSRGASGFWIEKGEIAYPVSEITVAGNLKDMFKTLSPADDLEFRTGMDAPSLRIDGMTVAGT